MSPRGATGTGKPAPVPAGPYTPRPKAIGTVVDFVGEDGRSYSFDVSSLPLPGWHESLAASWAIRVGPAGALRTRASADGAWGALVRMIRFFDQMLRPPQHPGDLRVEHVDAYRRFRESTAGERGARLELRSIALTFEVRPFSELVSAEVRDRMRPHQRGRTVPRSGYSDGELARLVAAARADVAALRDRLTVPPPDLDATEARRVAEIRATGRVPLHGIAAPQLHKTRKRIAEQVFVTRHDLTAMLVLLVAMTGWNIEVIKDLPAQHRIMEDLAVELEVTKRRRGPGRWHRTVTWEIGPPGKELFTPGGVYLLFHKLMASGRALLDEPAYWAVWHHPARGLPEGCRNPFAAALDASLRYKSWVQEHDIRADAADSNEQGALLRLDFNRLKSSIDVRRTRQMGGHLPSAARTNTTAVLFRNYLVGDHTTIDWARGLVAETLVEVEQAAWSAHRRALATHGSTTLRVGSHPADDTGDDEANRRSATNEVATAWANCVDHEHHPLTGRRCAASFLDCFHCGNCVLTDEHLPRLLSLLDTLEARRQQMCEDAWWTRYGPTWAAIRYEVLPKFSEAEVAAAEKTKPPDSLLDLVEPTWEQP